jgi:hypothetical protein
VGMSAWAVYLMLIIQARVRIYATLLSCVVTITTASPACCARGRFRLPLHLHPPSGSLGANQKNAFCGAIYIVPFETIILPRQARDTHTHTRACARARTQGNAPKKRVAFCAGGPLLPVNPRSLQGDAQGGGGQLGLQQGAVARGAAHVYRGGV